MKIGQGKIEGMEKRTTYGGANIDPKKLENPPNNVQPQN